MVKKPVISPSVGTRRLWSLSHDFIKLAEPGGMWASSWEEQWATWCPMRPARWAKAPTRACELRQQAAKPTFQSEMRIYIVDFFLFV